MLRTRVITAFFLLGGLLAAIFLLPPAGWLIVVSLVCGGAAWEWGGLGRFATLQRGLFAGLMSCACLFIGAWSGLTDVERFPPMGLAGFYLVSGLFWLLVAPLWLARKWRIGGVVSAVLVGVIVLLPPSLAMAHLRLVNPWLLLAAIASVSVADIAAYFTGKAFGRHKLAPEISPGKTWEGAAGAVCGVVAFVTLLVLTTSSAFVHTISLLLLFPVLLAFTAVSIQGDLFESLLKRQAGVKDSGVLLPGHGGILDRIDSLTSTLPLVGLAALWFAH